MKKLLDVYTSPLTAGPLSDLVSYHSDIAFLLNGVATRMDIDYLLNRSGRKPISPMTYELVFGDFQTDDYKQKISDVLYELYYEKWTRLYNVIETSDYNPIENYNMTEKTIKDETTTTFGKKIDDDDTITFGKIIDNDTELTHGKTTTRTDALTDTKSGSMTERDLVAEDSETITPGITTTVTNDTYPYNEQTTAVHESKQSETRSGEDTKEHSYDSTKTTTFSSVADAHTGTQTTADTGTDTTTNDYAESGTESHEKDYHESGTEKNARDYEFTRKGNIGVTTTQQMIEQEIELRKKLFYKEVYHDLDYVLCLQVY